jgi:hypothetical protein
MIDLLPWLYMVLTVIRKNHARRRSMLPNPVFKIANHT